ncbi:MAG: LysR family transcriptional regulator [Pseudomonadota bacterium]
MRHFIAVADCGTFSKASAQLNLTQPALTRSVQTLEETVGAALFERQPRGVTLTAPGRTLLRHAQLMLNQVSAAREEVHALETGIAGQLEIGLAPMFSATIIDQMLIDLTREFPGLRFRVTTALLPTLVQGLSDGSLDVVLSNIPTGQVPSDIHHDVLFNTRSYVLASTKHPLSKATALELRDLQSAQWAVVTQSNGGDAIALLSREDGFDLDTPTLETNSLSLLRTMLLSGQFLSVLPEHWLADDLERGDIVRLPVETMPIVRPAGVMMRKEPSRAASVGLFMEKARLRAKDWTA